MQSRRCFLGAATLSPGQGGIARVARMCGRALIEAGHRLEAASYLDDRPFEIGPVAAKFARGSKGRFALLCHLAALRADHCLYDSAGIARGRPRLPGLRRPYAVWIHGTDVWENVRSDYERAIRDAVLVLSPSRHTLERYQRERGFLGTGQPCWLGTEADDPPEALASFEGPPRVLIVSRLDASEGKKGHHELIECWPRVVDAVPDARLVIAGAGSGLEAMRALARSSPAGARIDVLGFVPEADMPALYRGAHVFAMPSRQEGFGLVYVEAMRYGLPVVASIHDAGPEVNVDGVTGLNVDLDRPLDLPEKLIHLLSAPDRSRALGAAGHLRWRREFTYTRFAERFVARFRAVS